MTALRPRILGAVSALVLGGLVVAAHPATAIPIPQRSAIPGAQALKRAAARCAAGEICFWVNNDYQGTPWRWMPSNGYRDMPPYLHDNVGSFYANIRGCFIDWDPYQRVRVNIGDYSAAYKWGGKFGSRIDAVGPIDNCR